MVRSGLPVAYRAQGRQEADGVLQHLPLQEVGEQHSFVKPTAAAKTSATPAAVLFFFALFRTS